MKRKNIFEQKLADDMLRPRESFKHSLKQQIIKQEGGHMAT